MHRYTELHLTKNKFLIILFVIAISISLIWIYRGLFQHSVDGFSIVLTDVGSKCARAYPSTIVVIVYPSFDSDYKTMKIQMGYPWDQPTSIDPIQTSKMVQYFKKTSKLIH
jgi:hypothetical protein